MEEPPAAPAQKAIALSDRIKRFAGQLLGRNPFRGDLRPGRVPLIGLGSGRPTLPFPHPWNYHKPLDILESFFWQADSLEGPARHNRYLEAPGFSPILVTRDPAVIRAMTTATGDKQGQFDRDPLPSQGIARATGDDTLLYSNGPVWKAQRKAAAQPFGKTGLFHVEAFQEFEATFRNTVSQRLGVLREHLAASGQRSVTVRLEPEIKAVMLEMLVNNFFGAEIDYEQLRCEYVPALERVIEHIVRDTVTNRIGVPIQRLPGLRRSTRRVQADYACFERLTDCALAPRRDGRGHWGKFKSDAPDEALRGNIKVFLAGALEATTSYAAWAISHLARNRAAQEQVYEEVKDLEEFTPENLDSASYFGHTLDETLRLTPSLYFLPRRATCDTTINTADGRELSLPAGAHVLLDVWHANRHEDHWGAEVSGYRAIDFEPERWEWLKSRGKSSKEMLHFGFGHGPRVCPGKHLGQLEVALVVGALVKLFRFRAESEPCAEVAGVSTKPADGVLVEIRER